ncbi:hypothetical protein MHP7448_0666 [Mesomycoplasma hyopneumoniae 7448]|uniref:Uncharacterized protein n=1 Tax=Mesomycoplasma hyopneumoniae (strain 7448) TaxID=262722 RepID=Q4A761_MESH7|nr:hypothetical protein MHP7448_0666 [Mesomycoplasma hyopneumoniae 7448]
MIAFNLQITNWIFYYIPSFERSKILLTVFLRCKDNCTIKIFFFFSFFFFFFYLPTNYKNKWHQKRRQLILYTICEKKEKFKCILYK